MRRLALVLLALAPAAACASVDCCRHEVHVRRDLERDRLDVLLLSEGVSGRRDVVESLAAGRRRICIQLLDWDLDDPHDFSTYEDYLLFQAVQVTWAQTYVDGEGRLSIAQHLRVQGATSILRRFNAALREALTAEEDDAAEEGAPASPSPPRTFADAGRDALVFEGPALWVTFPVAEQEAWHIEQFLKKGQGVQGITAWRIEKAAVAVRFGTPEAAECSGSYALQEAEYDAALQGALERDGTLRSGVTRETVLERFRAAAREPGDAPPLGGRRPVEKED